MAGMIGADVEALDRLASEFERNAEELVGLSRQLAGAIDAAHDWQGPDAERCKAEWGEFAGQQMTAVGDALSTAGRLLAENAREQERASGAEQSGSAPGYGLWSFVTDVMTLKNLVTKPLTAITKARALIEFLRLLRTANLAEVAGSAALIKALEVFMNGKGAGVLGALGLPRLGMLLGKAFLPLTALSGVVDVFTGGNYEGWRGWATRGFGLAGAAGAVTLLAAGAGLVATAPITATVAAVGVAAYGLWSAGNFVYDHWGSIRDTVGRVGSAISDTAGRVWDGVSDGLDAAKGWARGLLGGLNPAGA